MTDDIFLYIKKREESTIKLLNEFESNRLKNVKFPFYDGGLTPIILYYIRKYELDIKHPIALKKIKGDTLLSICKNFYDKYTIKPELVVPTELGVDDLFEEDYLKKYYFNSGFYNFEDVLIQFRDMKKENEKTDEGILEWVNELQNILLGMLALKENYKMGFKEKNQIDKYMIYITETVEKFINEYPTKNTILYFKIFWLYQLLKPDSYVIKINGYDILFDLFKKYFTTDEKKLLMTDENSQINNYFNNWIIFGLIKDYLSNKINFDYLKEKMTKETFKNKTKNTNTTSSLLIETFDTKKSKTKANKSYTSFILYCIIFAILLFVCVYGIIVGFPFMIHFIKKIFSLIMVK